MLNTLSVTTSLVFAVLAFNKISSASRSACGYSVTCERARRAPSISEAWFNCSQNISAPGSLPSVVRIARLAM